MTKTKKLEQIAKEIENCSLCQVEKNGMAVPGEGDPDAKIMFIGEAPGRTEAATGRPFIGRSGKLLRRLITGINLKESEVFITSVVKYLPDQGTPTEDHILHGRTHLFEQFKVIDPEIIVVLGSVAAKGVLGEKISVSQDHGKILNKEITGKKRSIFITVHPAAALRFVKFKKTLVEDFEQLKKLVQL